MAEPIPIARFSVRAVLCRRRVVPYSHSLYVVRVMFGSLSFDASGFPADPGWTIGVIDAMVIGGRLEIAVPPGVEVRAGVNRRSGGRLEGAGDGHEGAPHILLSGTVAMGLIEVRSAEAA